jgi:hypothetical protein
VPPEGQLSAPVDNLYRVHEWDGQTRSRKRCRHQDRREGTQEHWQVPRSSQSAVDR